MYELGATHVRQVQMGECDRGIFAFWLRVNPVQYSDVRESHSKAKCGSKCVNSLPHDVVT